MPGAIQVSVLEFNGPSSSSSPPSSIFLKVSMGKREYQTWDIGDFSFPLTTLRDNLIISLQDAKGNQISHTDVGTMSIVEKGLWDDLFPLEGGGHVHLRLQFILSKEERDRIRIMRESAMKKKLGASMIGRSQSLSSITNEIPPYSRAKSSDYENRDSKAIAVHNLVVTAGDLAVQSGEREKEGTARAQTNETTPNATDRSEDTSSTFSQWLKLQETEVHHGSLVEKVETHFPSAPIFQQEASSISVSSEPVFSAEENSFSSKLKNDSLDESEKQGPLEKIPNNGSEFYKSTPSVSMAQGIEVHHNTLVEKIDSRLPLANVLKEPTMQKEASSMLGNSKLVSLNLENGPFFKPKRRDSLEKTCSSVRKMISAFESGRSPDTRPQIKPPPEKSQPNKVVIKVPPKDQDLNDTTNPAQSSSEKLKNSFPIEELPQNPIKIMKTGDHIGFDKDLNCAKPSQHITQLNESRTIYIKSTGMGEVIKQNFKASYEERNTEEPVKSSEDLSRHSTIETATLSGRIDYHEAHSGGPQPCNSNIENQYFTENSVTEERRTESYSNDNNLKSVSPFENEGYLYGYCDKLLYPNDTRHLCVTTGGKEVMDLLGGLCIESKSTHEEKNLFSVPGDEGKHRVTCGTDDELKRSEKKSRMLRKSKSESSGDDSSRGPIGQVIKIAIIVGFGILVLLTRQSESRKSKRKENDNFFTTPYRMGKDSLADEEWE